MLLGVWIFTRIVKDHKEDILRTYVMSLGLMYGISKLGCFLQGGVMASHIMVPDMFPMGESP